MPKFNTMLDVAFTVEHDCQSAEDIPAEMILAALEKRVRRLRDDDVEFNRDAFGVCGTYEIEYETSKLRMYRVILCREASEGVSVTVGAATAEEANDKALAVAGKYGEYLTGWTLNEGNSHEVYLPDPDSTEELGE